MVGWESGWSEMASLVLDLGAGGRTDAWSAAANVKYRAHIVQVEGSLEQTRDGEMSVDFLQRLGSTVEALARKGRKPVWDSKGNASWQSKLVSAAGLDAKQCGLRDVAAFVNARCALAVKGAAQHSIKAEWRAKLVELINGASTSAEAREALMRVDEMQHEVDAFVRTAIAAASASGKDAALDPRSGSSGGSAAALTLDEQRHLSATLLNTTKQKRAELVERAATLEQQEQQRAQEQQKAQQRVRQQQASGGGAEAR